MGSNVVWVDSSSIHFNNQLNKLIKIVWIEGIFIANAYALMLIMRLENIFCYWLQSFCFENDESKYMIEILIKDIVKYKWGYRKTNRNCSKVLGLKELGSHSFITSNVRRVYFKVEWGTMCYISACGHYGTEVTLTSATHQCLKARQHFQTMLPCLQSIHSPISKFYYKHVLFT